MHSSAALPRRRAATVVAIAAATLVLAWAGPSDAARGGSKPCKRCATATTVVDSTTTSTATTAAPTSSTTSTTATTAPSTTTTTVSPAPDARTGDTSIAPSTQGRWTSPEGVVIDIATAGPFTVRDVYRMLLENTAAVPGDLDRMGPTLTIKVQDQYASSTSTTSVGDGITYDSVRTTMWLQGTGSSFAMRPDHIFAHELGHAWSLFHLYLDESGDWAGYLAARHLTGDPRLDSSYQWSKVEIVAEDFRLLFGSTAAISQAPRHMNAELPPPGDVPGLRSFLLEQFRSR